MQSHHPQALQPRCAASRLPLLLLFAALSFSLSPSWAAESPARIELGGSLIEVSWNDGDSFRVLSGRERGKRARLQGYNSLESYGAVHRWGDWSGRALRRFAYQAKDVAASKTWSCARQSAAGSDRYGRLLIRCPGLTLALVRRGLAHLFEIGQDPDPAALEAQREAIKARRGMWSQGAPDAILTSVHSLSEGGEVAYNRFVSTKTGRAEKHLHQSNYRSCEWVCLKGSCLLYVPFKQRYGEDRPRCLLGALRR